MATRERRLDRLDRVAGEGLVRLGSELRRARVSSGLSQRTIAIASGISHNQLGRIEAGKAVGVPFRTLVRVSGSLGLAMPVRLYPDADPIRDRGHIRLLDRFAEQVNRDLIIRREVPLPNPGDRRAWDAIVECRVAGRLVWHVGVEAETVVDDAQALNRKLGLKRRDGGIDTVILLIADTPRNRASLATIRTQFTDLTLDTREVMTALRAGRKPTGSGIVVL